MPLDVSSDEQPEKPERKGSKLSSNKQKKKVRYQELPSEEKKSPVLPTHLPSRDGRENQDPKMQPVILVEEEGGLYTTKGQKVKGQSSIRASQDLPPGQGISSVLVPETIPLDLDSDNDDEGDDTEEEEGHHMEHVRSGLGRGNRANRMVRKNLKLKQSRQRNAKDQYVVVPETVPMDSIPFSHDSLLEESELLISDAEGHFIPLEQSTPMLPVLPSSDSSRRKALHSTHSASPVYPGAKCSQKGVIPPTESQLSVDFSITQMSPTFARSRSTPSRPESAAQSSSSRHRSVSHAGKAIASHESPTGNIPFTPESIHSNTKMISSRSKTSNPVWDTPEDTNQARNSRAVTPDYDESGQSEASFLILQQPPSSRGPSQVRSSGGSSKQAAVHPEVQEKLLTDSEGERRKKRRLSDEFRDETASKKTRTVKQEDVSLVSSQRDGNESCNRDGRRKVSNTKTGSSAETVERQSSAAAHIQKTQHNDKNVKVTETSSYLLTCDNPKSMKQTRLTKDSFKAVISEDGQRLKNLNGGARVYVDSQYDPYLQQAIQESMEVQKGLNHDERTCNGDFKVPRLPKALDRERKSKGSSSSGATARRPYLNHDDDDVAILEENEYASLVEERDNPDESDDGGDLNGSIDPAVRFSFIGNEEDEDHGGEEWKPNEAKRADASGNIRTFLVLPKDSRTDKRGGRTDHHPNDMVTARKSSRANYDELEEKREESKHRLLVEDSLDDMFEDDDHDDGNDEDVHGCPGPDKDRQDQGIEIEEGYGLGEDNVPETSVHARTKFEDGSLHDPGIDPVERRAGETDEMASSFVREFDW